MRATTLAFVLVASFLSLASAQAPTPLAETFATRLQQRRNITLGGFQNVAPTLASLFSQAVANTNTAGVSAGSGSGSGTAFISGVASNFQQLLTDQASFYNNLLKSFSSSNATVAARTVCELGALYQALPSLLTSSSNPYAALLSSSAGSSMTNALSSLLSDSAYARVFNQECSNIGTSSGPLAGVASSLLGDSTIAQQVQAAIAHAKSPTSSGTSTSKVLTGTVPSYLQGTALGTFLQAISSAGSSGSSTSTNALGNALLSAYLSSLTGTSSTASGFGTGSMLASALSRSPGASSGAGQALLGAIDAAASSGINRIRAQAQSNTQGGRKMA